MELLPVDKKLNLFKKQRGFGLMESLMALVVFGGIISLAATQEHEITVLKKAKIYSDQTFAYANQFAEYLKSNNKVKTSGKSVSGNPNEIYKNVSQYSVYKKQLIDLKTAGVEKPMIVFSLPNYDRTSIMLKQTPCMVLFYDDSKGQNEMSGLVYYSTPTSSKEITDQDKITLNAINFSPAFNFGYFKDNSNISKSSLNKLSNGIISKNGVYPNSDLINFIKNPSNQCNGGVLADDSLLLNVQMLTDINTKLIANSGLSRASDQTADDLLNSDGTTNLSLLPNHMSNNNTLKSSMTANSVIFAGADSANATNKISVSNGMVLTGKLSSQSMTDNSSAILSSSIQPNTVVQVGSACLLTEVGKVAIARKETFKNAGVDVELARNLASCSISKDLCKNATNSCYLPLKSSKIEFTNPNGVEGDDKTFMCPAYAPYVANFASNADGIKNVEVFLGGPSGRTTGGSIKVSVDNGNAQFPTLTISNNYVPASEQYSPAGNRISRTLGTPQRVGYWPKATNIDFGSTTKGNNGISLGNASVQNIYPSSGSGQSGSAIGLKISETFGSCASVCPNLNSILGGGGDWRQASDIAYDTRGMQPITVSGVTNTHCGCANATINPEWIDGLATIDNVPAHITSVTCTSAPDYTLGGN